MLSLSLSRHQRQKLLLAAAMATLSTVVWPRSANALPPGRSWAPAVRQDHPGVDLFGGGRIETDESGLPFMIVHARATGSSIGAWWIFAWRDSGWVNTVATDIGAFSTPEIALSLTERRHAVWMTAGLSFHPLAIAEVSSHAIVSHDTAMVTTSMSSERDGAVSARRRWVVRSQQKFPISDRFTIRTVYSDTARIWHELPELGIDEFHCAAAPLGDTTLMVVYAGRSGLAYSIAEGDRWTKHGVIDARPLGGLHPRLRFRPSGGLWLLWTDREWVHVSQYRDGQWFRGDSLTGVHAEGETYLAAWCDPTLDAAERPVLAWGDLGYGYTYRDVGMVAFPNDSGWSPGEEVPGSENMFLTPLVARDLNGDVWAMWRMRDFTTNRWTHTYVHATTSPPVVEGHGTKRRVTWTLSEPAPESWWAVLRSRNGGPFEEAVRVQAGKDLEVSWKDETPPAGVLRYKIRRESVDSRYRWESPEASWPASAKRRLSLNHAAGASFTGSLDVIGADAGPVEVRVYDIQGRVVLTRSFTAAGSGQDSLRLDLGAEGASLGAGIYFATAQDASGRITPALKLVLLK